MNNVTKEKSATIVTPMECNLLTGYPEIICPNCKRHFYWREQDKEFYCVCGEIIIVKSAISSYKKIDFS